VRKTPVLNANENSVIIRAIVSMTKSVSGYSTTRGRSDDTDKSGKGGYGHGG